MLNTIRVLSYNIHHGAGMDGATDLARLANIIAAIAPDIVSLQEVDCGMPRTAKFDQLRELAEQTRMSGLFGCAIDRREDGQYGNAILARFPVRQVGNYPLPGEPRAVLAAHLDTQSSPRMASIPLIEAALAAHSGQPAILAGDFNAVPESPALAALGQTWTSTTADRELPTFPHEDYRQIDYILLHPAARWRVVSVKVVDEKIASDHLPIFADLELLPDTTQTADA